MRVSSQQGFSLVETVIALGVLTTGILGAAAVLAAGMQNLGSSPSDIVVTQKAAQAVETVFAARDSQMPWNRIRNVSDGGVFLDGPTPLTLPAADGLVNTADDGAIETMVVAGKTVKLTQFTREIAIEDVADSNGQLRSIVITMKYQNGPTLRKYTLSTFISSYS